jgi:lysozyme family protein
MQDLKFQTALTFTLQEEGGYSFDPQDPGGETNFGISKRSYPHLDIKNLTIDQASDIYYRDYWMAAGCYRIKSETLAAKLFDLAVNTGPRSAAKFLQHGVNVV